MDGNELAEHRKQRLLDFADSKFEGSKAALGRALGYRDGAFVGQMLRGERPITEKTVAQIHKLPGGAGWFELIVMDEAHSTARSSQYVAFTATPSNQSGEVTLAQALEVLGHWVSTSDDLVRDQVRPLVNRIFDEPGRTAEIVARITATTSGTQGISTTTKKVGNEEMPDFLKK